jgi:conjugal transfer/entry exclusion protein
MDVSELKGDMDRQFEGVARQFETIDRRFEEMLALIASQKDETRRFILEEGERTRRYMLEESESTRRHFDIVVEQVKSERNLALDKAIVTDDRAGRLTATNAADHVGFSSRLDDHELRLTRLERNEES